MIRRIRHLFSDPAAVCGRTLCGLDVKRPDPDKPKARASRDCIRCQRELRWLEKTQVGPRRAVRPSYHDRLAED